MRNLEQILAKKLLSEYKMIEDEIGDFRNNRVMEAFMNGKRKSLIDIATSIWGSDELNLNSHFEFIEALKEIANAEPQANLVEVSRFEAFGLYKHYSAKSVNAMQEGFAGASESYYEKAEKWLDVAVKIEKSDADGVNKNLVLG
jgi:hypothetical protein